MFQILLRKYFTDNQNKRIWMTKNENRAIDFRLKRVTFKEKSVTTLLHSHKTKVCLSQRDKRANFNKYRSGDCKIDLCRNILLTYQRLIRKQRNSFLTPSSCYWLKDLIWLKKDLYREISPFVVELASYEMSRPY